MITLHHRTVEKITAAKATKKGIGDMFLDTTKKTITVAVSDGPEKLGSTTIGFQVRTPLRRLRCARDILVNAILEEKIPSARAFHIFAATLKREVLEKNLKDKL